MLNQRLSVMQGQIVLFPGKKLVTPTKVEKKAIDTSSYKQWSCKLTNAHWAVVNVHFHGYLHFSHVSMHFSKYTYTFTNNNGLLPH